MVAIGIDLGTTNCVAAVCRNGTVEVIPNGDGHEATPSVVAFAKGGGRVFGNAAKVQVTRDPMCTAFGTKRLFGDQALVRPCAGRCPLRCEASGAGARTALAWLAKQPLCPPLTGHIQTFLGQDGRPTIMVNSRMYHPEQISAMLLGQIKASAERYLGEKVHGAVVTVPACFDTTQRRMTIDAATIAGLSVYRVETRSTAAVMGHYSQGDEPVVRRRVLVYNMGGGCCNISLLSLEEEGILDMIATSGDMALGGEDVDSNLVDFCIDVFRQHHPGMDLSADARALLRLREECERAKRTLSSFTQAVVRVDALHAGVSFSLTISRATFEKLNMHLFQRSLHLVSEVLRCGHLTKEEVDDIVLVGGSTRIPKICAMVREFFDGKELRMAVNAVGACGAAISAAILSGQESALPRPWLLLDVCPTALGVETVELGMEGNLSILPAAIDIPARLKLMTPLVHLNTHVPTRSARTFTTYLDNQSDMLISVLEVQRPPAVHCRRIGELHLLNIPPAPRGVPQIEVTFELDAVGGLIVAAKDLATGDEISARVQSSSLSQAEVDRMVLEEERYAAEDAECQARIEAKHRLERCCFDAQEMVQEEDLVRRIRSGREMNDRWYAQDMSIGEVVTLEDLARASRETLEWMQAASCATRQEIYFKKACVEYRMQMFREHRHSCSSERIGDRKGTTCYDI